MADDKKGDSGDPMHTLWIFVAVLAVLIALWYYNGGAERADLRGIFLSPPPPVGTGESYGPQVGAPVESAPQVVE